MKRSRISSIPTEHLVPALGALAVLSALLILFAGLALRREG